MKFTFMHWMPLYLRPSKRLLVMIVIGISSGLIGVFLSLLLRLIQHQAYGYSLDAIVSDESFLQGVRASSSLRRVSVLSLCGVVAGCGWWLVYRYGTTPVSIPAVVHSSKPKMPFGTTIVHALLQIVTVALGSPLGREVAPREVSALFACWLVEKTKLSMRDAQIMVACAAGAGLAAIYNVPFGGVLFVVEGLMRTFRWQVLFPAIVTSSIAVSISWFGLGNDPTYHHLSILTISPSLVIWSIFAGPIFGVSAYWFNKVAHAARDKAKHNNQQIIFCFINFFLIGLLAIYLPSLLGNGKSPAELEFSTQTSFFLTAMLCIIRPVIVCTSFRAGAHGGLLTPSLANGALLAVLLSFIWNGFWSQSPSTAFAIIGATAFLAAAQNMPITAIVLMLEFTRVDFNFLIPMLFATAGAVSVATSLRPKISRRKPKLWD